MLNRRVYLSSFTHSILPVVVNHTSQGETMEGYEVSTNRLSLSLLPAISRSDKFVLGPEKMPSTHPA